MSSMTNDLMLYSQGSFTPTKGDNGIAKAAKSIYDGARIKAYKIEARAAVDAHAITQVGKLIDHGESVAGDNPRKMMAIASIINQHVMNVQEDQRNNEPGTWGW